MKIKVMSLLFLVCLSFCLCLVSCNEAEHTHQYGEWVEINPATCTENGEREQVCSCGDKKNEAISAKGHIYENGRCTACGSVAHESGGIKFLLNADNTCSVIGINDDITEVGIPTKYNDMTVTSIGDMAFYGKNKLKTVVIPDCVTSIGNRAFDGCADLTSVTIGNGVTSIGENAFYSCRSLESIVIPDNVTSIGNSVFSSCTKLESVKLSQNLASIGNAAFRYCPSLKEIEIPNSVNSLGSEVFMNCTALTSISILGDVSTINSRSFYNCKNLTRVELSSSITSVGKQAFYGCPVKDAIIPAVVCIHISNKKLESVEIISGEKIEFGALANCVKLRSVVIYDGLEEIGESAFLGCESLESVALPSSITGIGSLAFNGCVKLQYSVYDNALYLGSSENPYHALVVANDAEVETCEINENTKVISGEAFKGCAKLSSLLIPNGVAYMGRDVFTECKSLTLYSKMEEKPQGWKSGWNSECLAMFNISDFGITEDGVKWFVSNNEPDVVIIVGAYGAVNNIKIPSNINETPVTRIYEKAFYGSATLESIEISNGVTEIGNGAFEGCTTLKSIKLPGSLNKIGASAFVGCSALEYNEYDNACYLGNDDNPYLAFVMPKDSGTIAVCKINENTSVIVGGAFKNCTALTEVQIPNGVKVIGASTFENCSALTSVVLPSGVTTIESNAFRSCPALESVIIPGSVEKVEGDAFYSCLNLTIYCEAEEQPSTWDENWNSTSYTVEWGYTKEN